MHEHETTHIDPGQRLQFPRYGTLAIVWLIWVACLMVWTVTTTGPQTEPRSTIGRNNTASTLPPTPLPLRQPPVPDALREAQRLLAAGDFASAVSELETLTRHDPTDGRAWFHLAYARHAMGDLERAIPLHRKAAGFTNVKPTALYNLACAYALVGATERALAALEEAVEAGFGGPEWMAKDPDLTSIRQDDRFAHLKEAAAKNQAANPRPLI